MFKLWITILKDLRILTRDRIGLSLMFIMPIVLAIVITSVQNSTFELVNENKIPLLLYNEDNREVSLALEDALSKVGMFYINKKDNIKNSTELKSLVNTKTALVAIDIPPHYSDQVLRNANNVSQKALKDLEIVVDSTLKYPDSTTGITIYYHPVLQESFRKSIDGGVQSALQVVQSKYIVKSLYHHINNENIPDSL